MISWEHSQVIYCACFILFTDIFNYKIGPGGLCAPFMVAFTSVSCQCLHRLFLFLSFFSLSTHCLSTTSVGPRAYSMQLIMPLQINVKYDTDWQLGLGTLWLGRSGGRGDKVMYIQPKFYIFIYIREVWFSKKFMNFIWGAQKWM